MKSESCHTVRRRPQSFLFLINPLLKIEFAQMWKHGRTSIAGVDAGIMVPGLTYLKSRSSDRARTRRYLEMMAVALISISSSGRASATT